ncbi:clathrin-coated vesicle protein [Paxillus ammoniavirescens]|nr:clathrin-coated vesicle protein [Paxillus ammoniavirescens]
MTSEVVIEPVDETQLTGDNGQIYLFQWLTSLEKSLKEATVDQLKAMQSSVEETLLKVICGSDSYPLPGRGIRSLAGRCFVLQYTRGDSKTLFDTLRTLLKTAGDMKMDKDSLRIAAFWAIGELMAAFGSQFMSFLAEIATISVKTFRSSNSPQMRYHALTTLRKALNSAKKALTDSLAKDVLKNMKNGLLDKALPVQRAAAGVLIAMFSPEESVTLADVESVVGVCVKTLEGSDQLTRQSIAQLVGHMLATTQVPRVVLAAEIPPKNKKEQEDNDATNPAYVVSENMKPLLTPAEMLLQLSTHFNRPQLSRKVRAGIFDFYVALLTKLGVVFAETNYALIVNHLMSELVSNPKNSATRYDKLFIQKLVGALLRDLIATRMLSEQGQIAAIQELSSSYVKRWPALMPGQVAPNSTVLTIVLKEIAELLHQLGNAPPPVQDAVSEPLLNLLTHPSHAVRVNASWTLRCFCFSTPLRLAKTILAISGALHRDIESLQSPAAPSDIDRRALGHAYGLAALVAIIPDRPLYVSFDVATNVLDTATSLLKRASEHDVQMAGVEVEVAWMLIASLMLLGPNFVRSHLPQLLVLWRNALPKPTSKDSMPGRSAAEWEFLLHVRESALGAILCFLLHNAPLVTLDVARRISSMLSNALAFTTSFISHPLEEPSVPPSDSKRPSLRVRESSLRRRIYQCFTALGTSSLTESAQSTLLQSTMLVFAGPEGDGVSAVQAAIASSSGTFTTVWQAADGFGYGVTTVDIVDDEVEALSEGVGTGKSMHEQIEDLTTLLLRKPVLGSCEHDTLSLCLTTHTGDARASLNCPPSTSAVVDASIELFSRLLPVQDLILVTRTITQLVELVKSQKLDKNAGRKAAVLVNSVVAIARALRCAMASHYRQAKETLGHSQVTTPLASLLKDALVDGDPLLRRASSEAIGRLANVSGTSFLTSQAKALVDHIVNNRDPQGRAGCALAFGALYSHVGGLAAAPILKTTVNILMSLSNDPHPLVHFWSMTALARVINAANLAFSPFIPSTLGMLVKLYMSDAHETEGGTLNNANISGDLQAFPVVCQIIDAIITVLGPDVQESLRTRTLILDLVQEFSIEEDETILIEAIKCTQHLLMFAPEHVDIPDTVGCFRTHLGSSRRQLKLAAIDALYQLVQKDALVVSRIGGDRLVEDLFAMLDGDPGIEGVRNVITSWLSQTAIHNPSAWIDLCQRIMLRTNATQKVVDTAGNLDDEGQSLNATMAADNANQERLSSVTMSRWRTQLFALHCLHGICTIVAQSGRREHLDIFFARNRGLPVQGLFVTRIPDLIKMAFTASAAYVTEIRLEGLVVLRDIIQIFSKAPDPDYPEALLLEQHQAPITAALTPAFSSDSTPEILSSAIDACAVFVGCGVVKDVSRMGRILKQLTGALKEVDESNNLKMGTLGELSPNASSMLRVSILAAWARLEIASAEQAYLLDVVKPYREILASQWIACLRDYATIRADSEFVHDSSIVSVDPSYASLGKVVLLPYYSDSWATVLQAVANAMEHSGQHISAAILRETSTEVLASNGLGLPRTEPAPLFFVIFGLIYEALAVSSPQPAVTPNLRDATVAASLRALKCLVDPRYSGKALLEPMVFKEFISLCYRMAMVENAAALVHLLEVIAVFAKHFGHLGTESVVAPNEALSPNSVRTHCLKICAYILRHARHTQGAPVISGTAHELARMVSGALTAFQLIASTTEGNIREDVRGVGCMLYAELLKDETLDIDLITPTLPAFKSLLIVEAHPKVRDRYDSLIHGMLSSCLLNVDEMRGREGLISSKKVKTNLLAAVLVLTNLPPRVKVAHGVVEHLFFVISQKLEENDDMAAVAVHCAKTVTVAASGNDLLRGCVRLLLPAMVQFIATMSPRLDDGSLTEQHSASIDEVWKMFSALLALATEEQRTRVLSIVLPTVALLLRPSQTIPLSTHSGAVAQLLTFAALSPVSFKEATAQLDPGVRDVLELSIRRAVEGTSTIGQATARPQISLRSF